jgi:hypothetical protein
MCRLTYSISELLSKPICRAARICVYPAEVIASFVVAGKRSGPFALDNVAGFKI